MANSVLFWFYKTLKEDNFSANLISITARIRARESTKDKNMTRYLCCVPAQWAGFWIKYQNEIQCFAIPSHLASAQICHATAILDLFLVELSGPLIKSKTPPDFWFQIWLSVGLRLTLFTSQASLRSRYYGKVLWEDLCDFWDFSKCVWRHWVTCTIAAS